MRDVVMAEMLRVPQAEAFVVSNRAEMPVRLNVAAARCNAEMRQASRRPVYTSTTPPSPPPASQLQELHCHAKGHQAGGTYRPLYPQTTPRLQ